MAVKLIVGLGNPGSRYQWTRHNAGFMVLDRLSHQAGIPVAKKGFSSLSGEGFWHGSRLLLIEATDVYEPFRAIGCRGGQIP